MAVLTDLTIELLNESAAAHLAQYLREDGEATVFHTLEWNRIIQESYGHQCHYWVARSGQRIVGVFPVTAMRYPLLGTKMVAMPYQFHSGSPLAMSDVVRGRLVERALTHARQVRVRYMEIRCHKPAPFLEGLGFVAVDSQLVATSVPLAGLDFKQLRSGHRRNIRYAMDQGVTISEAETLSDLKMFRRMYLIESRKMGNPQAGWNFFENLHQWARSRYRLLLAWLSGRCVGGLLTLDDGRTVFGRCGVYNSPEAQRLHVGKALLWRCMSDAARRGCQYFDFGISWYRDEGLISFKEGWNGVTRPVYLYVYPINSNAPVPGKYFEGFSLAKSIWRRLPLPVVDWAGQHVTQWVG